MGYILKNGISYSGNTFIPLTKAQYDALVTAGTVDPAAVYFITDRSQASGSYASEVVYDDTVSQLDATNVQNAIDEVATVKSSIGNIDDVSITSPSTGDMLSWDGSTWTNLAMATIIDKIYPVGSIYISVTDSTVAQVETRFGGTWVVFGAGRTLVGVDPNDTSFDAVEGTGGAKSNSYTPGGAVGNHTLTIDEMPSHKHPLPYRSSILNSAIGSSGSWWTDPGTSTGNSSNQSVAVGGGGAHNHSWTGTTANISTVQPYITTYMYKRIA